MSILARAFPGPDDWPDPTYGQLVMACWRGGHYHHDEEAAQRALIFPDMYPTEGDNL